MLAPLALVTLSLLLLSEASPSRPAAAAAPPSRTLYVVGGLSKNDSGVTLSIGSLVVGGGAVTSSWTRPFFVPGGGGSACALAFRRDLGAFVSVGASSLNAYAVSSGLPLAPPVPLSAPYALGVVGYSPAGGGGAYWGIGGDASDPQRRFEAVSVSPTTGLVTVAKRDLPFNALDTCEGALNGAGLGLYFIASNETNRDQVFYLNLPSLSFAAPLPWPTTGGIWSVAAWNRTTAGGGSEEEALVIGGDGTPSKLRLASVNLKSRIITSLVNIDSVYTAQQASLAYDADAGLAYAIMQGPYTVTDYVVATFNLSDIAHVTVSYAPIPGGKEHGSIGIALPSLA